MASRREANATDDSAFSVGSSVARSAAVAREYLEAAQLEQLTNDVALQRALTVKSVISTSSSFARRYQEASIRPELQNINQIGEGLQGTIFEQTGLPLVLKKERPGNDKLATSLEHEYLLHRRVFKAFQLHGSPMSGDARVPRVFAFIEKSDNSFWDKTLDKFPYENQNRTNLVTMERILPLPKVIRRALVSQFLPSTEPPSSSAVNETTAQAPNKHCLVRLYLGRQKGNRNIESFSLRNFPLFLNDMGALNLDTEGFAFSIGRAFAIMHWGAGVNGDDVEFVLGTEALNTEGTMDINFQQRSVSLYLLDFGQCDMVDLSETTESVYQAFKGAMVTGDNQLFIPHCEKTPALFASFKKGYIEAGTETLKSMGLESKFNAEQLMLEYEEYAEDFLF